MSNKNENKESIWRNGFFFALILLIGLGCCLIWIGAKNYPSGTFLHVLLVGIGISMAPASLIGILFRVFLFKEVRYQLTKPVLDEIKEKLSPEIEVKVDEIVKQYREEIEVLDSLKDAGVVRPFSCRERALKYFVRAIEAETSEIIIIGSSLKGLLQMDIYKELADMLRTKIMKTDVKVRFMLTHPIVADFRACQENRRFTAIGEEIINSLEILRKWGVSHEDVRFFKGTPTCFGIKTTQYMLLDPYPYCAVAYDSPCFIIEISETHRSYIYDTFSKSHFGAWDTTLSEHIDDYDNTINKLRRELNDYAAEVSKILGVEIR